MDRVPAKSYSKRSTSIAKILAGDGRLRLQAISGGTTCRQGHLDLFLQDPLTQTQRMLFRVFRYTMSLVLLVYNHWYGMVY